jgi:hypothetical protein
MTPILYILGAAFLGLAVLWPLSFFGYNMYRDLVQKEEEKHASHGGH